MSNVRWIKIVTNIFDDEKMLLIESMPDSDSLIVIWFKILCMAGKMNNGGVLMLSDKIAYTDEMLATIFRKQLSTIKYALKVFEDLDMIVIINNTITLPNWSKHQSLDQLENKKIYMRDYMKKYRLEQAKLASREKRDEDDSIIEEDIKAIEANTDKEIYKQIIDYLNKKTDKNYRHNSKATKRLIDARLNEDFNLKDFKKVIDNKVESWKDDKNMNIYLRPNTLFGTKFESYLNEKGSENLEEYGW